MNIELMNNLPPEVKFIQVITIDINGLSRGKMFPKYKLPALIQGKEEVMGMLEVLGSDDEIPYSIEEISGNGFKNTYMVPDMSSFRLAPWSESLAMVFYDTYDMESNLPWPFCPRLLAKQKLKELEDFGYQMLIGVENEFRLFTKATLEPIFKKIQFDSHFLATTTTLPFVIKLTDKLEKIGIEIDSWNLEYGMGQVEIPLKPYLGLDGVDKVWLFRELSKYVAHDMDMVASYMTSPLAEDTGSGMHINHSLLRKLDSVNVLQSEEGDGKLSEVGQHWLAGLIKHSRALTAITSPTVNCYRRIKNGGFAPDSASWNYSHRNVGYRVKTSGTVNNKNYIENRNPSSSCNIYIAIAGMVVAGLDGVRNKLPLMDPGRGSTCESLPVTLEEALDDLRNDSVMKEGLGETFVDWYIKAKTECDVTVLKNLSSELNEDDGLEDERKIYFVL